MTNEGRSGRARRKALPALYSLHRGPVGFANLMVSVVDGTIVLDPQITGSCVITLEEDAACELRDMLREWLG